MNTPAKATDELVQGDVIKITEGQGAGELRFFRGWQNVRGERYAQHSPATTGAPYSSAYAGPGTFEWAPPPPVRNGYSLEHHILPRVFGWKPWGHVEEVDGATVANALPGGGWMNGFLSGSWRRPDGGYDSWVKYALVSGQGTPYTGEAYALVYGNQPFHPQAAVKALADTVRAHVAGKGQAAPGDLAAALSAFDATKLYGYPRGFRVAVCKHEKVVGPGARPMYGWHPGSCRLCGMDMTVDSSD